MERRQLEYFLAVAEHESATAAAAQLHVAQPTISVALRSLEKEFGGQLFERTSIGLALTAAGLALLEPARQVLRDFAVAQESVRDVLGLAAGHLDIVAVPAVAAGWLLEALVGFRRAYPQVGVRVYPETDDNAIAAEVRSGRYNLGLTVSSPVTGQLTSQQVGTQRLNALLPPGSSDASEPIGVDELAAMSLVTMHPSLSTSRRWLETQLNQRGTSPNIRIELGSTEGIMPLVTAGAGYALWWTPMMGSDIGECVLRPILPSLERPIIMSHRSGALSPATEAFLKIVGTDAANTTSHVTK
ncbi:LysR family transcriptional regulator [Arthrobacter sp. SLBN-112]|jgi:DNA-binding transcriptional LysR family regulator|nr:LysR family transcriptional regulator [Arthrobacter sp. SLBN-112]